MSENDKPFSFTDKRKFKDGEEPHMNEQSNEGISPEGTAGGAPHEAEANNASENSEALDQQNSRVAESAASSEGEVDELSAEAGALYDDAVREADALKARVAELEEQLKRDQAEYVNSRRRIEQSAIASQQNAVEKVLTSLLSVMDDIALARQHGDLEEGTPFAAIASKLEAALGTHGLERFGEVGEEFDPAKHESLMHQDSEEATSTTLNVVMQPGYMCGDRVLRPARVGTVGPQ